MGSHITRIGRAHFFAVCVVALLAVMRGTAAASDHEQSAGLQACERALLAAAAARSSTNPDSAAQPTSIPKECTDLASRPDRLGKRLGTVFGQQVCLNDDFADCLDKAFDIDSTREVLGLVRRHCSSFVENAWHLRYDGRQSGDAALRSCSQAMALLEIPSIKKLFDGHAEGRRSIVVDKCRTTIDSCARHASCREIPICAAAIDDMPCSGPACTRWFERGRKDAERRQEIVTRTVMEQVAEREERHVQADDALRNQNDIAESSRKVAEAIAREQRENAESIAKDARASNVRIAAEWRDTTLSIAEKNLAAQQDIAQEDRKAAEETAKHLNDHLGKLAAAVEKLGGNEAPKTESPVRQIDPNQPVEQI